MKKEKGITLIALLMMIIVIIIVVVLISKASKYAINKEKLENLKTNMLLIQCKSKAICEQVEFKHKKTLIGIKYDKTNNSAGEFVINDKLKEKLNSSPNAEYYIWKQEDYHENGIENIEISNEEFYVIDYTSSEIYYSLGYTENEKTYYTLTELQEI